MSTVKNVLFITNRLYLGGLERVTLELSRALSQTGRWRPIVHYLDDLPDGESLRPEFRRAGIRLEGVRPVERFMPERVAEIRRFIRRENVSVIHTHDLGPLMYGALVRLSLGRRVRHVHTTHTFVHVQRRPRAGVYERIFSRLPNRLCVVSPHLRDEYARLGVRRPIEVCENGISFPSEAPTARERAKAREELAPGKDGRWILCLARVDRGKGQDTVLDVWHAMSPGARRESRLFFVGPATTPEDRARLEALIAAAPDRDRITYAGATAAPARWLTASDVFVSGSRFEGMPLAPIEAAGAGLPVLLTDIPGHAVLREHAALFPAGDPAEGARRLAALALPRWKDSDSLRARFGVDTMARRYEELYE